MNTEAFIIKSPYVQNTIMLVFLAAAVAFFFHALVKKRPKRMVVFFVWILLIFWFFNSPLFGFSTIDVGPKGIKVYYGILSFRNTILPIQSKWEVKTHMSGIRKNKRLYFIRVEGHESMKVKGQESVNMLQQIGEAIEAWKSVNENTQSS